jgi:hypothetical protein
MSTVFTSDNPPPTTLSFNMTAGTYMPIRMLWVNADGNGGFKITLTDPAGNELLGNGAVDSYAIVQNSCDNTTALVYPPFGAD